MLYFVLSQYFVQVIVAWLFAWVVVQGFGSLTKNREINYDPDWKYGFICTSKMLEIIFLGIVKKRKKNEETKGRKNDKIMCSIFSLCFFLSQIKYSYYSILKRAKI